MGQMASILFIVVMFAFLYFFMIRPQRKQQQQHQQMLSKIKRGDKVTTIGRLHGVVDEVNETEKTVTLDCDGIYLVFDLNAVAKISPKMHKLRQLHQNLGQRLNQLLLLKLNRQAQPPTIMLILKQNRFTP